MATSTLRAESAHVTTPQFDPVDWLARFRDAGGWWLVHADDKISIGRIIHGQSQTDRLAAAALMQEIEDQAEKAAAVQIQILADFSAKGLRHG